MVRHGRWKLFHYAGDSHPTMYDLETDPGETRDLAQDPAYATVCAALQQRLWQGWDPAAVLSQSRALDRDLELLMHWGRTARPTHPDTLPVPDVEEIELR